MTALLRASGVDRGGFGDPRLVEVGEVPRVPWGVIGVGAAVGLGWFAKAVVDAAGCVSTGGVVCPT